MEDRQSAYSLNTMADNYYLHQDEDSLRQVIESVAGLIRYFARLYGGGCAEDDLFQSGNLGMLKALKSYDPGKGPALLLMRHIPSWERSGIWCVSRPPTTVRVALSRSSLGWTKWSKTIPRSMEMSQRLLTLLRASISKRRV